MTKTFEIYWDDLTEDCQKRLSEFLEFEDDEDDGNYSFFPISSIEVETPIQ